MCSSAGFNCSFISFIPAIFAKVASCAFISTPNLSSSLSFRTFSDPFWSSQGINFWIGRFSFTRKQVRILKLAPENHCQWIYSCLLNHCGSACFHNCPALPHNAHPSLGVLFMCWVAQICVLSSVYLKCLWFFSSIFSAYTFLYLLIHFRCLFRSLITPCLSHCSFWDFLTHTLPCKKAPAVYAA